MKMYYLFLHLGLSRLQSKIRAKHFVSLGINIVVGQTHFYVLFSVRYLCIKYVIIYIFLVKMWIFMKM